MWDWHLVHWSASVAVQPSVPHEHKGSDAASFLLLTPLHVFSVAKTAHESPVAEREA